ncbi:uncharacterized protein LOC104437001 isoform X1 [Eucalyptus grandis]|uniref:uncharacterized protein LOC104437001 isoform X1 n=1 Tax=Eucalyptus grandis TaxID=71139 RepID=UPI00192EFC0D|nr:uncharacterized protein LOC104437001 isoform X1 [Eucalyptus grandis]
MCCQSQESDICGCTYLGRLLDLSCLKTLIILNINHCEEQDDIQSLEEASGGKVQKHIGEGEWSCCWTCGTLDSQNSSGSFKLIISVNLICCKVAREASGGRVQNHIGKEERSCCWACGPRDPHNALGSFKLIIRCEFGLAVLHGDMKCHFQVVAEMEWSQWLGLVATGIQLDWSWGQCNFH